MILAALCDLGADPAALSSCVRAAGLAGVEVRFERRTCRHGLVCGYVDVLEKGRTADGGPTHQHGNGDGNGDGDGDARHPRPPTLDPPHDHDHEHGNGNGDARHPRPPTLDPPHDHDHEHGDARDPRPPTLDPPHDHDHDHEHGDARHPRPPTLDPPHDHDHDHEHDHDHDHRDARDPRPPTLDPPSKHAHRGLREILALIERLEAPLRVRERAAGIFRRLGAAEAAVHGVPVSEIHFHEVGAVDSITDIVGICLALEQLGVERVYCSALTIGQGTIRCAHGTMPNPAPATALLLEGADVIRLPLRGELTTPTAAAVLTTLSSGSWDNLPMRVLKTGSGHGRKEFDALPNLLRAFLVEVDDAPTLGQDTVTVIECDIDDQSGEVMGALSEDLLKAGALDVSLTAVQMKKNRPGTRLTVLCRPADVSRLAQRILSHSSSIGLRTWPATRLILARGQGSADTPWGQVACKRIERPDGVELAPEFESARRVADAAGVPVRHVLDAARRWEPRAGS